MGRRRHGVIGVIGVTAAVRRDIPATYSGMRCLAIDPGNCSGWAIFLDGELVRCGVCAPKGTRFPWHDYVDVARVIIELPQIYPNGEHDPNDLIKVAYGAGFYAGTCLGATVRLVLPREWKGQVPKPVHNRRVLGRLRAVGRPVYERAAASMAAGKVNNMVDAIGLGLYAHDTGWFK